MPKKSNSEGSVYYNKLENVGQLNIMKKILTLEKEKEKLKIF